MFVNGCHLYILKLFARNKMVWRFCYFISFYCWRKWYFSLLKKLSKIWNIFLKLIGKIVKKLGHYCAFLKLLMVKFSFLSFFEAGNPVNVLPLWTNVLDSVQLRFTIMEKTQSFLRCYLTTLWIPRCLN